MEIIGTNLSEKEQKSKKIMKIIIILIIILMVVSIILGVTIYFLKLQQFKFVVDGKNTAQTEGTFIIQEDKVYVSIKDIASIIGYKYYNGGYKQYSEDVNKCYVENDNEVCTFEKDSNKIYKTSPGEVDYEYFTLDEPVKRINGKLYTTLSGIERACNLDTIYNKEQNKITIYTLPYLAKYYTENYNMSAVGTNFKNQKALLYGLLVVQDVENTNQNARNINYGIYSTSGEEIVGTKYSDIEFIESTEEFIVTTTEKKVGIITSDGETKVRPQYDSLKQIDKDLNLYLATSNGKQGVLEKNGKILIYLEYDKIGIDLTQFPSNDIKNSYLLYDNAIPVKQNGKWGLYDIKGNLILPIEYDGFGCVAGKSSDKTLNNILIIPDIEGIVVSKIYELEDRKKFTAYGIVNSSGKLMIPTSLETVYSITNNGRDEYTMIYNGDSIDILEYVREYGLDGNTNDQTNETTNELTNEITNTVQNTQT